MISNDVKKLIEEHKLVQAIQMIADEVENIQHVENKICDLENKVNELQSKVWRLE